MDPPHQSSSPTEMDRDSQETSRLPDIRTSRCHCKSETSIFRLNPPSWLLNPHPKKGLVMTRSSKLPLKGPWSLGPFGHTPRTPRMPVRPRTSAVPSAPGDGSALGAFALRPNRHGLCSGTCQRLILVGKNGRREVFSLHILGE